MAKHIDTINHNSWYDGITLTNCTYTNVKDGCTGTISNCNFIEIGEGNTNLTVSNVNYLVVYNHNNNLRISSARYIIVGDENRNINVGGHQTGSEFEERTGANSITVNNLNVGVEITGKNSKLHKTVNSQFDGSFNKTEDSGCIVIDNGVGNALNKSKLIAIKQTNNNVIATENLELVKKDAFVDYATVEKVKRVEYIVPSINKQSDNVGVVLDIATNKLINGTTNDQKELESTTENYTIVGGQWTKIKK